ncbi:MAG: hypothetical protein OJF51_001015 [Nitrospira sp.]|nr:MAG: hypothetical protein OJF51_001015 [Nitrospira sp.]
MRERSWEPFPTFWKESWWVVQTSLDAAELASEPDLRT